MKEILTASPFFGICITVASYRLGLLLNKKTHMALFNPLLIAEIIIISILLIAGIPVEAYNNGGMLINMFLSPITALLAVSIYKQREKIKRHLAAIVSGTLISSIVSILTIIILSNLLGVPAQVKYSLIPKSVTTPIAIAISSQLGGIESLTVTSLLITGILGNVLAPFMIRLFCVKSRIASGVAIGGASHVVGTSKAFELGEDIGSISSIALSFSGIITALIALIFFT